MPTGAKGEVHLLRIPLDRARGRRIPARVTRAFPHTTLPSGTQRVTMSDPLPCWDSPFPVTPSFTYIAAKLGRCSHGGMRGRVELSVVVLRDHLEEKGVGVGGHKEDRERRRE